MWSTELKPQAITHGKPGKFNRFIYVVDIHFSSVLVERHIFLNGREYISFRNHLKHIFPIYTRYRSALSYDHYHMPYTSEDYNILVNFE